MSIEDRIRQAAEALETEISSALAGKVKTLADELASVAVQERVAAEAEAMARFAADVAAVREEAERLRHASVTEARAEVESALGIELQRARAEAEALRAQTQQLKEEADQIGAEAGRLKEEVTRREEEIAQLKDGNDRVRDEFDRLKHEFDQFRTQADRLREEVGRTHEELHKLRDERDRLKSEAANALDIRAAERESTIAGLERLANTFRRLDGAAALSDVLGALAEAAAAETARVALLVSSQAAGGGDARFKLWSIYGFPTTPDGFELTVTSTADLAQTGLPFAPLNASRAGLALPIQVGGRTVAVLYADDGEAAHAAPAGWPEAIELLARHAAARLEGIIALRSAQALGFQADTPAEDDSSARRYAKLLISEIKMYNEAPVRLGRQHRDLYQRLREEIERARRLFEERVSPSGGRQAFDDELVQTLAGGDASLLGIAQAGKP